MGNAKPAGKGRKCRLAVGDKYRALHQRSLKDPEGFWAEQAKAIDWTQALGQGARCVQARRSIAGSPAAELNTCHNALDRHVEGGRAEQTALIYDSPVTGTKKSFTYRELRDRVAQARGRDRRAGRRQGRPGHHLHADDPRGGDGDAGLRAAGRGAFRGVRRLCRQRARHPHRRLPAQAGADRVVRHRARPHRPVQAVARPGDRDRGAQGAAGASCSSARRRGDDGAGPRPRLGRDGGGGQAARLRAGEGDRSALHPLHVGHDRPAQGRGARHRRLLRGARLVDARTSTASSRARSGGAPRTWAGWWATATSSTAR